ncbi:unnamed protein product [Protopolystoma xenopodis]|uniref:Uncharacterized protein n=1 Tax=Protopolystoma xenopodis TaxID=117903 RepID=A0A3S5CSH8_9PLAT|nr:unnamed protein product [Protopolystoma xenopodis]
MSPNSDDARQMTNESSARLRPKRWRISRKLHQPERLQYNANQLTSSVDIDIPIFSSCTSTPNETVPIK